MNVTISLLLTSATWSVDDFELAIGSIPDYRWGKGDHRFVPEGLHLGGFRPESYAEFDLFDGAEVPLTDALQSCVSELARLSYLFAGVRESGGSSVLRICRSVAESDSGDIPDELRQDLQNVGLDVFFGIRAVVVKTDGVDPGSVANITAIKSFVRALVTADDAPGTSLTVCVKYRGDGSVYEGWAPPRADLIGKDCLGDPGFGPGPVMYSDIEWLCVPAVPRPPRVLENHSKKYSALLATCMAIPGVTTTEDEITFVPHSKNDRLLAISGD